MCNCIELLRFHIDKREKNQTDIIGKISTTGVHKIRNVLLSQKLKKKK